MNREHEGLKIVAETIKALQLFSVYISVGFIAFVGTAATHVGFNTNVALVLTFFLCAFVSAVFCMFFIAEEFCEQSPSMDRFRIRTATVFVFFSVVIAVMLIGRYIACDFTIQQTGSPLYCWHP